MNNNTIKSEYTYYYWLDTFRFLSAFLVMLTHLRFYCFTNYGGLNTESKTIFTKVLFFLTNLGNDAIIVFFVISGFLVGGKTIEKIANHEDISAKSFAIKRIVRIVLPLFAVLVINTIFNIIQGIPNDWYRIIGNLLCLQGAFVNPEPGVGVLWTMSYIVWFYVLIFGIILLSKKDIKHIVAGLITIIAVFWIFSRMGQSVFNVFYIAMGILAYFLTKKKINKKIWIISILIAIISTLLHSVSKGSLSSSLSVESYLIQSIQMVSYAVVIGLSTQLIPQKKALKTERFFSKISKISYSLYLIHLPIILMMVHLGMQRLPYVSLKSLSIFFCGIVICTLCGYLFYYIAEKPSENFKKYIK